LLEVTELELDRLGCKVEELELDEVPRPD